MAALPLGAAVPPRSASEKVSAAALFTSSTRKLTIHTPPIDAVCITRGTAYCEVPIIPHG